MNIALVDDTAADRQGLEAILKEYDTINRIGMQFEQFADGADLLKDYQPLKYAIVFLDIYMESLSGIETARRIRETDDDTVLVFLTTSEEHRPEAFSVFAAAYLGKPCRRDDVFRVLDHVFHVRTEKEKRFFFSFDRQEYSLRYSDIVSMETVGNYLSITDREHNTYRTRMTFSAAEKQLEDRRFLSLMKGVLVNLDYVLQIGDGRCLMQGGAVLPLRLKDEKELQQKWLNYKFAKIRREMPLPGRSS